MLLVDGDELRLVAGVGPLYRSIPPDFRIRLTRESAATRAVVDRATVHIHDFAAESEEEYPVGRELAQRFGHRSMLAVPLLREEVPIGVICAFRLEVRPFPEQQIALLRAFADQAVIAIENVRLFKELKSRNRELTTALDRQTATAELLRVISQSQTDVQPVFETIADSAVRLLGAWGALVFRYDGSLIRLAAARGGLPGSSEMIMGQFEPRPPMDSTIIGRTILRRAVQHIVDIEADLSWGAALRESARRRGWRSNLQVPMLSGAEVLGVIGVSRAEPGGFSPSEITLLETFADQAVIAVKNARLLDELQTRTAQLSESVDELTALADVGRALGSTLDLETVLSTIVTRAVQIAGTAGCTIWEYDEPRAEFLLRASHYADAGDAGSAWARYGRTSGRFGKCS
jgi:GAF domain-containing protein